MCSAYQKEGRSLGVEHQEVLKLKNQQRIVKTTHPYFIVLAREGSILLVKERPALRG
jgi:hypothetical protein